MIRVTVWYEYVQEKDSKEIQEVYPKGLGNTIAEFLGKEEEIEVTSVHFLMSEYGLPEELLNKTDVLIWWAHIMHKEIPDELAQRIITRVHKGMGFIALHSAHLSKPFTRLLGTTGTLKWREGDSCRIWNISPTHPICDGIPEYFDLDPEEMYGEPFDIAKPDDLLFISSFSGKEVFRSGCTWQRGYGKIFYFQPGHETYPTYHNEYVQRIITNAVYWAAPRKYREQIDSPHWPLNS